MWSIVEPVEAEVEPPTINVLVIGEDVDPSMTIGLVIGADVEPLITIE